MSREIRQFEDIKNALERDINLAKLEKKLWEGVKLLKKKDGSDFAVRSKSFENANWTYESYSDEWHPILKVSGRDDKVGYQNFQLYCYIYADELKKDDPRKEKAHKAAPYVRDTYVYSNEEVMKMITNRIQSLDNSIKALEKEVKISKKIYDDCIEELKKIGKKIKGKCDSFRDGDNMTSLEYYISSVIENKAYEAVRGSIR